MHRHLIIGADHVSSVDKLRQQMGLALEKVFLLTRIHSTFFNSPQYSKQTIPIRDFQESRIGQLRRLLSLRNQFNSGTYFWRDGKGFAFNLIGLFLVIIIVKLNFTIAYQGQVFSIKSFFARLPAKLPQIEPIPLLLLLPLVLIKGGQKVLAIIKSIFLFPIQWFYPIFCSSSYDRMNSFLNEATSRWFRLEDAIASGNRRKKQFARFRILLWAASSVLWTIVLLPVAILFRVFNKSSDKINVLLISHESRINGAPQSLLTILEALDRTEFNPILLSAGEGLLTLKARSLGIPVFVLPLSQVLTQNPGAHLITSICRMLINIPYLLYLMVYLKIKIVHTNVLVTPDAGIVAKMIGITHLWHFREHIGNTKWANLQVKVMDWFSDRIFCNSEYSRRVVNSKGVFWHKMVTVHNALDIRKFKSVYNGMCFRASINVGRDEILIGCVGQITPVKGQETFVKAAIEVARELPNVKFALVGTMENELFVNQLKKLIIENSVEDRIVFCGYRTDIPEVMAGLDIHVTPSHWAEPFGRVALEAMASGAVSVVSEAGGLPEIVEHGVSGVIVKPGDVAGLVGALTRLIRDVKYREILRDNGIKRAEHMFSIQKHVDDIQQIYRYPDATITYWSQSLLWSKLQKYLPGRLRSHPKMLFIYPVLALLILIVWSITIPLFIILLPFAFLTGWVRRKLAPVVRVAVLAYQPQRNASTRYRVTKIFNGFSGDLHIKIFYPSSDRLADKVYVPMFYGNSPHVRDFYYFIIVFCIRLFSILCCYSYHCTVIQYELFNQGPMWMELLVACTHPYTIYDYDDSLFAFPRYAKYLPRLIKRVNKVVVGNEYLLEYSKKYNDCVTIIPTCPDHTIFSCGPTRDVACADNEVKIGWVGNPANLCYLPMLKNALFRLSKEYPIQLVIVSAGPYDLDNFDLKNLPIKRKEWSLENEGKDICDFDIGVMPVIDDEVGKGKCGFKALQYMAAGLPCVISPVGVNSSIIDHGVNGFLASTEDEWYECLKQLIESPDLRMKMGQKARDFTSKNYNLKLQAEKWKKILMTGT